MTEHRLSEGSGILKRAPGAAAVATGAALVGVATARRTKTSLWAAGAGLALMAAGVILRRPRLIRRTGGPARHPQIHQAMTILRPRRDVYAFWRRLEDLAKYMKHISSVELIDERRSRWTSNIPGTDSTLSWTAEITRDEAENRLSWQSLPGGDVDTFGDIRFEDAPGDRGTEIHVAMSFRPAAGGIGHTVSRLLNPTFERLVREDLRRCKNYLEAAEIPTTERQPAAR